ncbi:NTP transferase domain-containing protein [Bacillus sp. APMAM]|nr:NTP transferase domain-containing protein [Bacillus sp. APMAM]
MCKIKQAVILAAGKRRAFETPVGILELEGITIIERIITILNAHGIDNIIIITGFKKELYEDLANKRNISLVHSEKFKWTGTLYSLALASGVIEADFLLIESDLVFEERAVTSILNNSNDNCILISNESGSGDEVFVEIKNNHIYKISKDIHQLNKIDGEFIGLSKISLETYKEMVKDFNTNNNPYLNYEYSLLNLINKFKIGYEKIDDLVWSEIDTLEHYTKLIKFIYPKLKRKELEVKKQSLKRTLSEALDIDPNTINNIEKLGGLTNNNYKINIKGNEYVARFPGIGTDKIINRLNEMVNSSIAYKIGLNIKSIYFNEYSGLNITEYIPNAETLNPTTAKRENNMDLIANVLKKLHSSEKMFLHNFDPFFGTEYYENMILNANGKLFDDYLKLKDLFMPLKDELNFLGIVNVSCHLDPLPENFVKSGEEKLYLIDWEYSGNYDYLWDIAAVCLECGYSQDEEELFFRKYFGKEPTETEKRKIEIHKIIQDMYWSLWSAVKVLMGDKYLSEYSLDRYNRFKLNLGKFKRRSYNLTSN